MKRMMILFLAALLTCLCATAGAQDGPAWNEHATWVVYGGRLDCTLDDGTQMSFVVDYRTAFFDEGGMMCFWLAYEPDGGEPCDELVWIALGADVHGLVLDDDGHYRLLIEEEALQEAYETWLAFR